MRPGVIILVVGGVSVLVFGLVIEQFRSRGTLTGGRALLAFLVVAAFSSPLWLWAIFGGLFSGMH
jgi:hypothetical protein